jgi:hypothetical protein
MTLGLGEKLQEIIKNGGLVNTLYYLFKRVR